MSEYWLVSLPGDPRPTDTWKKIQTATSLHNELSVNSKFEIPELKVGTLDTLVALSDELAKHDVFAESVTRKVAQCMSDILDAGKKDKVTDNLKINNQSISQYLSKFQWETSRFPIRQSPKALAEMIVKQLSQIEGDLKTKSTAYSTAKANLLSIERRQTGTILTRSLNDIVKKEHMVVDSEYLSTVLVVVPRALYRDWEQKYETLSDMVVPRSSKLIYEDAEYGLYSVTLFKKVVDEYKLHARENKFTVREFVFDEASINAERQELTRLESDVKRQYPGLVRWLKANFGEAFAQWMHIKALRVFVESVLRYGLPVNFQALVMKPQKKSQKKLRETLEQMYGGGDIKEDKDLKAELVEIPGLMVGQQEYYPYVYFPIGVDLLEH
ncbi:V-type proton ATPase subunit C 1-B-like [Corticium candelabrum]|uniref:V-type proton ATPase subunit C 1-B-like n=1 Tax=Corticium candelabrum TaxID=121492 RepID=UPI002E26FF92|nr:V-type proton ATPase subunit C 1-B-like [Corticium candelabrum]